MNIYRTNLAVLTVLIGAMAYSSVYASDFDKKAAVDEAKTITKSFAESLGKELKAAMKAGGPRNALEVCNLKAMPITEQATKDHGAAVSRVSLKNRNPGNVPNDWQRMVLAQFDKRAANGEDVKTMASATVSDLGNGKHQLRFMKALPTGGVCLACHGQQIDESVQSELNKRYPDDKATGYALGQVRGAIVVVKNY